MLWAEITPILCITPIIVKMLGLYLILDAGISFGYFIKQPWYFQAMRVFRGAIGAILLF